MEKFRKKPITVEAEQFSSFSSRPQYGVCGYGGFCKESKKASHNLHVHTIHFGQTINLEHGDWVIQEPDGIHFYAVKPDIFQAIYEPV